LRTDAEFTEPKMPENKYKFTIVRTGRDSKLIDYTYVVCLTKYVSLGYPYHKNYVPIHIICMFPNTLTREEANDIKKNYNRLFSQGDRAEMFKIRVAENAYNTKLYYVVLRAKLHYNRLKTRHRLNRLGKLTILWKKLREVEE